jgi:hypothetical protein
MDMKEWSKEKMDTLINEGRIECMSDVSSDGTVDIRWTSNRRRETVQIIQSEMHVETTHSGDQDAMSGPIVESTDADVFASQEVPPTIVEGSHEEVFPGKEEEWVEFGETQAPETMAIAGPESIAQPEANPYHSMEQPAGRPPRPSKRPYIDLVRTHLECGDMDKKQLLGLIMEKFPSVSRGGAGTFLSDLLNPKYTFFRDRPVVKMADGKLIFADRVPAELMHEEHPTETPTEQPAE